MKTSTESMAARWLPVAAATAPKSARATAPSASHPKARVPWQEPFGVTLRTPYIFNLRMDPYERAQLTANTFYDWMFRHVYLLVPAQALVAEFLQTFREFPPRQKAARFSLDQAMATMEQGASGGA